MTLQSLPGNTHALITNHCMCGQMQSNCILFITLEYLWHGVTPLQILNAYGLKTSNDHKITEEFLHCTDTYMCTLYSSALS